MKNKSRPTECQTVWTLIKPDEMIVKPDQGPNISINNIFINLNQLQGNNNIAYNRQVQQD